jgi:hypothetical protein
MKSAIVLTILIIFLKSSPSISQDFWEEVIIPDSIGNIFSVNTNSQSQLFICSDKGVYISTDNGTNWELLAGFIASTVEISTSNEIYIGLDSYNRILYSSNNGLYWDTIQTNFNLGGRISLINDTSLFAFDWGWICKSTNNGYSWDTVLATFNTEIFNDIIQKGTLLFSGSTAFLDPQGGGINQSINDGNSWQQISLPGYGVSSFALDQDSNLLCGVRFQYYSLDYGVFRSIDNGFTWDNILPGYLVTSLVVDVNGGIYAGCDSDFGPEGVQYSLNNGMTWTALNSGLPENASIVSLAISPNGYIYTVTVFPTKLYRSINPILFVNETESEEKTIKVYPNPCQNVLTIQLSNLSLREIQASFTARVFSSYGMQCFQDDVKCHGNDEFSLDVSGLKSGFYNIMIIINNNHTILTSVFIKN